MAYDVVVGLGINPEVSARYTPGPSQKLPAKISMQIAGTSVNVAFNLRQWDRSVNLIGSIGVNCPYRGFLASSLKSRGVDFSLLPIKESTSVAVVSLPDSGWVQLWSDKSCYCTKPYRRIRSRIKKCEPRFILATGVIPEESDLAFAMFTSGCSNGTHVLNPRRSLIEDKAAFTKLLKTTDILAVNEDEFCGFSGNGHVTFDDMTKIHGLGPKIVLVTRDSKGAMLTTTDGLRLEQPAIESGKMVDEVGAGDCFLSYFILGQLLELDLEKSMKLAAIAAGIKVTKVGGSNVPTKEEIQHLAIQHGVKL